MQNLIINEELRTLLPPLSKEEYAGLEASILKDGILTPLVIWNDILIDGHHRYEICMKHTIPFSVSTLVLDNLEDAKLWAWEHQKNRRNLTPYRRSELALRFKDAIAAKAKERQRASGGDRKSEDAKSVPKNSAEPMSGKETRQELAELAEVSHDTLKRVEYITKHADEETKENLRKGEKGTSINKEYNRIKGERKAKEKAMKAAKEGKGNYDASEEAKIASIWKGVKINQTYNCGIEFKPDPDDDFFDWITDEERETLRKMQATCPNRLVPPIRNYTIQCIPEHKPEYLLGCLFSLFGVTYRKKLFLELGRKMFRQDSNDLVRELVTELYNELVQG